MANFSFGITVTSNDELAVIKSPSAPDKQSDFRLEFTINGWLGWIAKYSVTFNLLANSQCERWQRTSSDRHMPTGLLNGIVKQRGQFVLVIPHSSVIQTYLEIDLLDLERSVRFPLLLDFVQ